MEEKAKLVLIPNYYGHINKVIDEANRLTLPVRVRRTISDRNRYNLMNDAFQITRSESGIYQLTFQGFPFADIQTEKSVTKKDIDISSIDDVVFVAEGIIRNTIPPQPDFISPNPDTVFIYSATDAQTMIYDPHWAQYGFSSRFQKVNIESQGRITLKKLFEESEYLINVITDKDRNTRVTGQPTLFCVTLSKPPS
ncbi:hypothetical protein HYX02_07190 [Candidatus Woesearchaeota archaeon]|nr:hypothetical protein [Candidatus Woesearchaeota archaeon]